MEGNFSLAGPQATEAARTTVLGSVSTRSSVDSTAQGGDFFGQPLVCIIACVYVYVCAFL